MDVTAITIAVVGGFCYGVSLVALAYYLAY
jgi:hypothetical protein